MVRMFLLGHDKAMIRVLTLLAAYVAVAILSGSNSCAQSLQFPTRPLQLVVTFPPGGSADFVARIIAEPMGASLGRQVAVVNRAGAAGTVGTEFVATAPADGYTLVFTSVGALVLSPAISKKSPYETLRDLAPISLVAKVFEIMVASKASGIHSLPQLVAAAKQSPGKLTYGSTGIGSLPHVAGELLKLEAGIDLVHVPYAGGATAMSDLLAGRIDVLIADLPTYLPLITSGSVTALCVSSADRASSLPSVPTAAELGFPALVADNWYGLLAPAQTPRPIIDSIGKAVITVLSEANVKQDLARGGAIAMAQSPQEFSNYIAAEQAKWSQVIERGHITME
jgi:tripartite-type tricarboxylate transporter receptor subunit TctC